VNKTDPSHPDEGTRAGDTTDLAQLAERRDESLARQYLGLMRRERKWFLAPVLVVLLLAGMFVVLGGTAMAPFIYALF